MNYRRANNVLLVAIVLVNGYILAAPLWPGVVSWWQLNHTNITQRLTMEAAAPATQTHAHNRIVVPDMGLSAKIGEGSYANRYAVLRDGIWRDPHSSKPGQVGNTVLAGHRFTYTQPRGIFYTLNKVHVGSDITVFWEGAKYHYRVRQMKVVKPINTAVLKQTTDKRLTLYTCTPLFHPDKRLVVIATEYVP